jgi:hypothetical protein
VTDFLIDLLKKTRLSNPAGSRNQYYIRGKRENAASIVSNFSFANQQVNNILPGTNESAPPVIATYLNTESNDILTAENDNKLIIE